MLEARPYWRYIGGLSANPRPEHLAWSGTVLRADDPWWNTHYPPNGWGCKCQVASVSQREMERDGLRVSEAPPVEYKPWENPHTGEIVDVPKGIDPGWAYNPGKAAWGEKLSEKALSGWKKQGAKAWERLTPGDWKTNNRTKKVPLDKPKGKLDRTIPKTAAGMEAALRAVLGEEKVLSFQAGEFRHDILVNAKKLASHMDPSRAAYIPLLPETLEKPFEVWAAFEKHKGTGQVVLRQRIIKAVNTGEKEGMLVVTNAVNGVMEAWTMVPVENLEYLNRQRSGKLVWKR